MGGTEEVGEPTDTMEINGPEPDTEGEGEGEMAGLLLRTLKPGEEAEEAVLGGGDVLAAGKAVRGVVNVRLAGRGGRGGPSASVLLLLLLLLLLLGAVMKLPPKL